MLLKRLRRSRVDAIEKARLLELALLVGVVGIEEDVIEGIVQAVREPLSGSNDEQMREQLRAKDEQMRMSRDEVAHQEEMVWKKILMRQYQFL